MTVTEIILNGTIWVLTACGTFFGLRAWLKRRAAKPGRSK